MTGRQWKGKIRYKVESADHYHKESDYEPLANTNMKLLQKMLSIKSVQFLNETDYRTLKSHKEEKRS